LFGRVEKGLEFILTKVQLAKVGREDKPVKEIAIVDCGELKE
jgi:hypothetical protein